MSTGIMASAVVSTTYTDALLEPFNDFTTNGWVAGSGTPTIVAGRTGNAAQVSAATAHEDYSITSGNQSDTLTVGFAWRRTDAQTTQRDLIQLYSDTNSVQHNRLHFNPSTSVLTFTRGGTAIQTASSITFTQNTWYYIEVQAKLHDTTGTVIVRVNAVEKINATTQDTKNGGTKTVYDAIRLMTGAASCTGQWDDLYLTMGTGAPFKGDITIP